MEYLTNLIDAPFSTLLESSAAQILALIFSAFAALHLVKKLPAMAGGLIGGTLGGIAGVVKHTLKGVAGGFGLGSSNYPAVGTAYEFGQKDMHTGKDIRIVIGRSRRKGLVLWTRPDADSAAPGSTSIHQWRYLNPTAAPVNA